MHTRLNHRKKTLSSMKQWKLDMSILFKLNKLRNARYL